MVDRMNAGEDNWAVAWALSSWQKDPWHNLVASVYMNMCRDTERCRTYQIDLPVYRWIDQLRLVPGAMALEVVLEPSTKRDFS